uniref:NADH dehydrogenase subunit 6 n=1 Tax=Epitrimerus sabinae TaxID=1452570 RepID=A0A0U2IWM8_9ACAR|nr:NADH dehydrogenase subunit 6 [Epitrimerus sabinae]ALK03792.1 NADH dehydrogenase subunit 6 [Epitrimerus sabinae]
MMTLMKILIIWLVATSYSGSPVKLIMNLLKVCLLISYFLMEASTVSWFPLIYLMLMAGGVLIMFMILSSLMPNIPMGKTKMSTLLVAMVIAYPWAQIEAEVTMPSLTAWFEESVVMAGTTLMMLYYFFAFVKLVGSGNIPLRSCVCQ